MLDPLGSIRHLAATDEHSDLCAGISFAGPGNETQGNGRPLSGRELVR